MSALLGQFIPKPDRAKRHATLVRAPADLVLKSARNFDLQSIPLVHAIFWLRNKLLRAKEPPPARGMGLVALTQSIGWGVLVDQLGAYVSGAVCQPWEADVVFCAIPPEHFAAYAEPDRVKIVWSLEVEAVEPTLTLLCTETRIVATDDSARAKFRRYCVSLGSESLWSGRSCSRLCVVGQNANGMKLGEEKRESVESVLVHRFFRRVHLN